jgi:hypothetical protein
MENCCRDFDRSLKSRLDDAYRDYVEAIDLGHEKAGYQDDLARFYLDHRQCYVEALESVECALAASGPGAVYEDLVLHMLKAEICAALGNWTQTLSGLEHVTGVMRRFLLDVDWHASAHTSISEGPDFFGEQIRTQLLQCIQASDRLTRFIGPGALRDRAMRLLTEQGKLRMLA